MDLEGKVIQFLGETNGTSKAGNPWKKKEWVLETMSGQFPRKVKVQCFGDRADSINLIPGTDYILGIDIESREFNGRWYTDVNVFRAQVKDSQSMQTNPGNFNGTPNYSQVPYGNTSGGFSDNNQPFSPAVEESDEDLPF